MGNTCIRTSNVLHVDTRATLLKTPCALPDSSNVVSVAIQVILSPDAKRNLRTEEEETTEGEEPEEEEELEEDEARIVKTL